MTGGSAHTHFRGRERALPAELLAEAMERIKRRIVIDQTRGCWIWQGRPAPIYGQIAVRRVPYRVHRIAYAAAVGEIPAGALVCHRCDVPLCCNPAHLFLGSHADNTHDAMAKGRFFVTPRGTFAGPKNPRAKLSPQTVATIRARNMAGEAYCRLGAVYGVSRQHIRRLCLGMNYVVPG